MPRISKDKVAMGIIKSGRRFLSNTPANNWPISSTIKGKLFRYAHKDPEIEVEYKGAKLRVPTTDTCLTPGIVGGYYESIELDVYKELASVSKTILDVGGNIGLYAAIGARALRKGGKLYTFEPVSENIELLKLNLSLNDIKATVQVENVAVGDSSGKLELFMSKNNVGNHSASKRNVVDNVESISVKKIVIDKYVKDKAIKKVDILKVDVEGYDGFVLDGAMKTIVRDKPTLFVEFVPKLMKNCGYNPDHFISSLFRQYRSCYLVNESNETLVYVEQSNIKDFMSHVRNSNLIFVQNASHDTRIKKYTSNIPQPGARSSTER